MAYLTRPVIGKFFDSQSYLSNIADSQIFGRTPKFSNLGVLLTPKQSGSKSTPEQCTYIQGLRRKVPTNDLALTYSFSSFLQKMKLNKKIF